MMSLFYQYMEAYMGPALFAVSVSVVFNVVMCVVLDHP